MSTVESTAGIYDGAAGQWARRQPVLLSDYTARPFVMKRLGRLSGEAVLDLGCGEGYVARQVKEAGASRLLGIDVSEGMITLARETEASELRGIEYAVGSATDIGHLESESFDLTIAIFLFNYLTRAEMTRVMTGVARVLRPGGRFLFTVPHPLFPFLRPKGDQQKPFYFDRGESGYFSGRDQLFEGMIWRRDGASVPVRCVHKAFGDYFTALGEAGFKTLPEVTELHVTDEHIALDPEFFGPLAETPLHVAFHVTL